MIDFDAKAKELCDSIGCTEVHVLREVLPEWLRSIASETIERCAKECDTVADARTAQEAVQLIGVRIRALGSAEPATAMTAPKCERCTGRGKVPRGFVEVDCPRCHGTGEEP